MYALRHSKRCLPRGGSRRCRAFIIPLGEKWDRHPSLGAARKWRPDVRAVQWLPFAVG